MITIFRNFGDINNPQYISVEQALNRIKTGRSKEKIDEIREKVKSGEKYDKLKEELPFVIFAAGKVEPIETTSRGKTYSTCRLDKCVKEHSGYFPLDWDEVNVEQKIQQLKNDPYIFAAWVAPSGLGVKALVKCPPSIDNHPLYYTAFLDRYPELDPTSRNIGRGTYESYDPNIYINPNSLVWDRKMKEEERKKLKEKSANRRATQVISTAVGMVRAALDGEKHTTLLKAAKLLGGYVAIGRIAEDEAAQILEQEIAAKNPEDMEGAKRTIRDGLEYGKAQPLIETKKLEKAQKFFKREDGTYEFLADEREMLEYELAVVNGTLEMGLSTGVNGLNKNWMFKKHHIVWFGGMDNTGKSFLVWYLAVLAAKFHGWKILIHSAENSDGMLRKKLKEFFIGKPLKLMDSEEHTLAHDFVKEHFRIISSKQFHTLEDFLLKAEVIYEEGFQYEVLIAEPWNSFDPPKNVDRYSDLIHSLNILRVFKENYSSVWVCDHVSTNAARNKDKKTGFVLPPIKGDIEMGVMKGNKTDDFLILHRVINDPENNNNLQIHVVKVKDVETGGFPTVKDEPVILTINKDYCGYTCNYVDPIKSGRI